MIYIAIVILLLVLSYIYDYRGGQKGRLFWWIFMMTVMICVAGLRYRMGTDSIRYEVHYQWQPPLSQLKSSDFHHTRFAPFFIILSSVCRTITSDFVIIQMIVAVVVNCTIFRFIWRMTPHIFVAALFYFFFLYFMLNMEVLRESFAVCIFLWSWPFIEKRKWWKYYCMAILAFMFHVSAIVLFLLPLCFLPGVRNLFMLGKRTFVIVPSLLALSYVLGYFLLDWMKFLTLSDVIVERAATYSKNPLKGTLFNAVGAATTIIEYVLFPMTALYFIKMKRGLFHRKATWGEECQEVMTMVAVYVGTLSIGMFILGRYNHYFQIFALITVADFIFSSVSVGRRLIRMNFVYWTLFFMSILGLRFYSSWFSSYSKNGRVKTYMMYYPYSDQFTKEISHEREMAITYSRYHE